MAAKIKLGDRVMVMTGRAKGEVGSVLRIFKKERRNGTFGTGVVVEGVNMLSHYIKANPQDNEQGGIIKKEGVIDYSNVALFNSSTSKPDHVKFMVRDGKKQRVFKSDGSLVDA